MKGVVTVLVFGVVIASTLAVGAAGMASAQDGGSADASFPDEISIETVAGENADQVNEVDVDADEPFEVTVSGVEEFDERFEWTARLDGQPVTSASGGTDRVSIRIDPAEFEGLEEGSEHDLEVALTYRDREVATSTRIRVARIGAGSADAVLPDEISIETVAGADANQVNEVDVVADEAFEVTVSGVEEFDDRARWRARLDGQPVTSASGDADTVSIRIDPAEFEGLEEGREYDLEVALTFRDREAVASTRIRVASITTVQREREGPVNSSIFRTTSIPSGIPSNANPAQEIRLDGRFMAQTEPRDLTLTFDLYGENGLPDGLEVTNVDASSSAWATDATPTEEGFTVEIQGEGGPRTGDLNVTVEFDATDVYTEDAEIEWVTYEVWDDAGDLSETQFTYLWAVPLHVAVETPSGERLTPDTDRENWRAYYDRSSPPYDPVVEVFSGDGRLSGSGHRIPTAEGVWTVAYRPDLYLRASSDDYADPVLPMADVDSRAHMWPDDPYVLELEMGEDVEVALEDQHGHPLPDGSLVLEDDAGIRYQLEADDDGVVRAQLAPGEYAGTAVAHTALPTDGVALSVTEGDTTRDTVALTAPGVVSASVEHVGGTEPDVSAIAVDSIYYEGAMIVALRPADADPLRRTQVDRFGVDKDPYDLSALGVDETTELRLTLEFEGFEPDSLMWAARDARWEVVERDGDRTVVEIETKATELQKIDAMRTGFGAEDTVEWPTGDADVADEAYGAVVELWLWDMGAVPGANEYIQGVSVLTNAQIFSVPRMDDGELSVYMAAPSKTVDEMRYTGFYQAYLPDELLEEWGVEDPERDLAVTWRGESEQFQVTEVDGGVYVEIDPVTFSDGRMEVRSESRGGIGGLPVDPIWLVIVGVALVVVIGGIVVLSRR